jgi:ABC-type branched-subunit amino acid transport system substrate-binding protein
MAFSVLSLFNRFSPSVLRQAVLGLAALGVLAACGTTGGPGAVGPASPEQPSQIPEQPRPQTRGGLIPPFMADRAIVRVGLLLPFSTRPDEATALYRAAELALFERGHRNILLIPRDSGGGEREAEDAARSLVQDGVDVIVGPVLREGVVGAARVAQRERIPLIGLSSDRTVAAEGVYLLSFQLEDEVARIVDYAASQGVRAIAVMGPDNEYGRRVAQALRAEATARGMTVVAEALYTRDVGQAAPAVDRLTAAIAGRPVQAVLVADSGSVLRAVGAALGRAGLAGPNVRLLGTSAWGGGDLGAEAPLVGGWYVSADPSARGPFEQSFRSAYSEDPSRLSSLAYDAVSLAALLSRDAGAEGLTRREIERQEGFLGSDGIFRFRRNGTIERGWAVMEVRARSGPVAVQAAPRQFDRPAS